MKTKWGSCNRETGHIWFNVELAKKHLLCLEYIIVHEMAHLLERNHGERFTRLMEASCPTGAHAATNLMPRHSRMRHGQPTPTFLDREAEHRRVNRRAAVGAGPP